ncbi:ATP-binding protein [Brevibacillus laterosporus]|uniref:histidine kinase n=1 Tax=Brevibacillus laterosporus LMG 15441 TaxID=1042163 RepID=A0A075R3W1_BRELA|nr:ATP-binding protein [Brevibacillus laterosporus]WPS89638.1 ATP-binding protein [Brevibacillus halotolerans]AIG26171.1 sensor protein SrrB [Brevibacillus laterosporus LMG 15441]AUM64753.1 HAMP domain-containing protein [Brevibacillus laterosporus]AYK07672.1 HAMP domain-containing protein [Brevibacillus laterosporus]MCR8995252.1 ATP-binding protein [Brevibacillus laterosporus]
MDNILRSVVGKLWMTIIALFAVVLTIFSLLLVQSFGSYYLKKQSADLALLGTKVAADLETVRDQKEMLKMASKIMSVYHTGLLVVDEQKRVLAHEATDEKQPSLTLDKLLNSGGFPIDDAFAGKQVGPNRLIFGDKASDSLEHTQFLAMAIPFSFDGKQKSALILYQAIQEVNGTYLEIRQLIFVVGVIGFILTTVFAFFLSSRITSPLRQIKQSAQRIAEGEFNTEIPLRSTDEIGELAAAFNVMTLKLRNVVNALSHEKEQMATVLRSMIDGVIMLDQKGRVVLTNPQAEDFTRDWAYENQGRPLPIQELYQKMLLSEQEVMEDFEAQGRFWSVVMVPLYDHNQVRGAVAVLRDMTKERKLDKLRQDFVANISHELRTPLSMLQGYSEAIVDGIASTPEEHKELAKIIYDESVRMTKLVNELLSLARMEAGHVELHEEVTELLPYFERVLRKFANRAAERNIEIQLDRQTDYDAISIDPDKMEQVLTNLIDNAIRHIPDGGLITVRIKNEDAGKITIEVIDTGSGIPQEDLPFVFERFYKADKARTRGRAGTGLGLAIAKNIVAAHNGKISVQSKMKEGTTFTITIPVIT